ncbi:hypothetical protein mRhiFer1_009467 [Rhinolophus ferrumequinum]|uniref:Uncharacterized protein n=1 Tax=Rhinolophus ferrumequinum TaxID=59479 RepID=A0A7J7REK4_RHIFE|nr:hypothetical protein mRhiFer1_009467 [Rhinolophus ferrumequinum]
MGANVPATSGTATSQMSKDGLVAKSFHLSKPRFPYLEAGIIVLPSRSCEKTRNLALKQMVGGDLTPLHAHEDCMSQITTHSCLPLSVMARRTEEGPKHPDSPCLEDKGPVCLIWSCCSWGESCWASVPV